MKRLLLILSLFIACDFAQAQPDKVYKSLKDVKNPDDVYILKLTYKRLKAIPPQVFTFTNLRELNLGCNFIDSLPPEIANLTNLEVLNLERNWLHYLPDEIGELRNLVKLDLNRNPLQQLPAPMSSLSSLERLVLWGTGVSELPVTFVALDATLKLLDLRECYLTEEQIEAICELLPSVKKYWTLSCNCKN